MDAQFDTQTRGSVGIKDVIETLQSGEVSPLQDTTSIEAALELIKSSENQISQFKDLKKKRLEAINDEIETLETRVQFFKNVITETLKNANQKTIKFPGLGKVSRRTKKGKWVVNDETEALTFLKNENEFDNCVEVKEVIKKTELNKLLDVCERVDKVPSCVEREPAEDAITITYDKENIEADKVEAPNPVDYDSIIDDVTKEGKDISDLSFV